MGRTVYLFGPASSGLLWPGEEGASPPADPDLLRAASRLPGGLAAHGPHLLGFLESFLAWRQDAEVPDFDRVLGLIDLEMTRRKGHNREALRLARRDAWALAVGALAPSMEREPCPAHLRIFRGLGARDAVLSLARPALLDACIAEASSREGGPCWDPADGYARPFRKVHTGAGWHEPQVSRRRSVKLLKLRGSFNWLLCKGCGEEFVVAGGHPLPGSAGFRFPCVHPASFFEPVWLPAGAGPAATPGFSRIWTAALGALRGADRLVVADDPRPDDDLAVEWLLRRALARRRRGVEVVLVGSATRSASLRRLLEGLPVSACETSLQDLAAQVELPLRLF